MSHKYKLSIAYDGTAYSGWQVQPNAVSIQSLLEGALNTLFRTPLQIHGSGRTDSGVHARGQVAHFSYGASIDLKKTLHSLNGLLPPDIRVLSVEPVDPSFHARYSALGKIYHYNMRNIPDPFNRLYSYLLPYPIDFNLLSEAAERFVGKHDFTSFSNETDRGSAARNPVRTIRKLELQNQGHLLTLVFEGDGFLYKMVRNITGTLLDIARGKIPLNRLDEIFSAKDRKRAAAAAPAHGLFLMEVLYPRNEEGIEGKER